MRVRSVLAGPSNNRFETLIKVPTICDLCLYLGFESRQSFYDYEKKEGFAYTIKRARLLIEREYEEQLQTNTPTGAIFALKNFGWKDTYEGIALPAINVFIQNILQKAGLDGQPKINTGNPEVKNRISEF